MFCIKMLKENYVFFTHHIHSLQIEIQFEKKDISVIPWTKSTVQNKLKHAQWEKHTQHHKSL